MTFLKDPCLVTTYLLVGRTMTDGSSTTTRFEMTVTRIVWHGYPSLINNCHRTRSLSSLRSLRDNSGSPGDDTNSHGKYTHWPQWRTIWSRGTQDIFCFTSVATLDFPWLKKHNLWIISWLPLRLPKWVKYRCLRFGNNKTIYWCKLYF